jgi:hypothetical protein
MIKKLLAIILEIVYRNDIFPDRKVLIQGSESVQKETIYGAQLDLTHGLVS